MAQYARVIPCDICDATDDVNSFCVNCKQNYCDNCKKGHLRSASSKHHKFLSIGDGLLVSKRQGDTCTEHNEQVQFFCKTCGKATCSVCVTDQHKRHDFGLINQMASAVRNQFEKATAMKEEEIKNISQQISTATVDAKYIENSEKNIATIKQTTDNWVKGIREVEKELIDQELKEATDGKQSHQFGVATTEEKNYQCMKKLQDVIAIMRTYSDAALLEQESDISRQLAAIVISSPPDPALPIINLRQATPDAIRAMLEIERTPPQNYVSNVSESMKTAVSLSQNLLDEQQEVSRFKFGNSVYAIATLPGSRAWVVCLFQTLMVDIKGKILVKTKSRKCGAVATLSNGDALYTPSDNVISRIDQTGKVSAFIYLKSYVNDILAANDDVFVATKVEMHVLDNKGRNVKSLDWYAVALTSLPNGKVAAIDGNRKMMVIQASDCKVLYKNIDVTIDIREYYSATAFTADKYGRIITSRGYDNTIRVFEVEREKASELKVYRDDQRYFHIYALDTDDSDNLWIGIGDGEVIVTKYCHSD